MIIQYDINGGLIPPNVPVIFNFYELTYFYNYRIYTSTQTYGITVEFDSYSIIPLIKDSNRSYSVNTLATQRAQTISPNGGYFYYKFTNPILARKISFSYFSTQAPNPTFFTMTIEYGYKYKMKISRAGLLRYS